MKAFERGAFDRFSFLTQVPAIIGKARDYRPLGAHLANNINILVTQHPDSFVCLLFRADASQLETVVPGADVVGTLESTERGVAYQDPDFAKALILPNIYNNLSATNDGAMPSGFFDEPVILCLDTDNVPKQSVIQYEEYIDDSNVRQVNLYVVRSEPLGSIPGAGMKHYCVQFQAFNDFEDGMP